jgi:hypothetical protein
MATTATNKTDDNDINEILLKVTLNTINQTTNPFFISEYYFYDLEFDEYIFLFFLLSSSHLSYIHNKQTVHFVTTWLFGSRKQACCTKLLCMADKGKISGIAVSKYSTKKAFDKSSSLINICITRYTCVYGESVNEKPSQTDMCSCYTIAWLCKLQKRVHSSRSHKW